MLVAGFVEIKNARVKKFSNIRENLLHILSGMQVLTALVLIENIHYKNKMDSEARLQNKNIFWNYIKTCIVGGKIMKKIIMVLCIVFY